MPPHRGSSRGRGGNNQQGARRGVCRHFQQSGHCPYGEKCHFSHDLSSQAGSSDRSRETPEQSPAQAAAHADYNTWKRIIKFSPKVNDIRTIESLWKGALDILNNDEGRDWKQQLPHDLDSDEFKGREHLRTLPEMRSHERGSSTFIEVARPFLAVITHQAIIDCLSVDTYVGGLYNFISGSNGTRAISFFQQLSQVLLDKLSQTSNPMPESLDQLLITIFEALRELLKREPRANFNEDLPALLRQLEEISTAEEVRDNPIATQIFESRIRELDTMIASAEGLLRPEIETVSGISTTAVTSTYPRDIVLPRNRHDNDKLAISEIKLLPTEDEIRCDRPEFLPSTDLDTPHFLADKVARHIDTHFRLLRHDIFGELKDALGGLLTAVDADRSLPTKPKLDMGGFKAFQYLNAFVSYISFDGRRGLEAQVSFDQPPSQRKRSSAEKRIWWEDSRRLEQGILLCLLSFHEEKSSILFLTVTSKPFNADGGYDLNSRQYLATTIARLATHCQEDLEALMLLSSTKAKGMLIELPGVILDTFIPILRNLQNLHRLGHLPFRQWILPDRVEQSSDRRNVLDIPRPLYARHPSFSYSLKSILNNPAEDLVIRPRVALDDQTTIDEIEKKTPLDRGQAQALLAALLREFSQIQGPPGTGKSFVGVNIVKVLLSAKKKADLGPIVIVCYTNHALDQFLEHLHQSGITKLIRMGGSSKSEELQGKNLHVVSQEEQKTRHEAYLAAMTYKSREEYEITTKKLLKRLNALQKRSGWDALRHHLAQKYRDIHERFSAGDDDGFEAVGRPPFDIWLTDKASAPPRANQPGSLEYLLAIASQNPHSLTSNERTRLVEHWTWEVSATIIDELFETVDATEKSRKQLSAIHDDVDRRVLQSADIIGVTTTGLAKRIDTLRHVRAKVLLCEEAGEIMEPHILSALLPSCEHVIAIGDHQQLRPQINNHKLSLESQQGAAFQLDRSQFERLAIGEKGRPTFPIAQLTVQRRMRPEISKLIKPNLSSTD